MFKKINAVIRALLSLFFIIGRNSHASLSYITVLCNRDAFCFWFVFLTDLLKSSSVLNLPLPHVVQYSLSSKACPRGGPVKPIPTRKWPTVCPAIRHRLCALPPDKGPCRARIRRFYYDQQTNQCKRFTYGGCQGNRNNFKSKKSCLFYCPSEETFFVLIVSLSVTKCHSEI